MAPKPLAAALNGVSYNGMSGSTGGDISRAIQDMLTQGEADRKEKTKNALDQSLLGVKQTEVANQGKQYDYNKVKDERDFGLRRDNIVADNSRADLIHGDNVTQHNDAQASLDAFRTSMVGLRTRGADQADTRIGLAGERLAQSGGRANLSAPDENGDRWFVNPVTHAGSRAMIQPDGSLAPEDPSVLGAHLQAGGHAMPGVAAKPTAAAQGHGVAPDGSPEKPIQPGSTQVPADIHGATTDVPASHPMKAPTPQLERNAAATFQQLKGLFSDVTEGIKGVNYQPPGALTAFGTEMAKGGAIPGVPDAIEKIAGNTAVGMFAPKYQTLEVAYNSLSTFLTQMITGAQMSQQEADRIRSLVAMRTGDNPKAVALRLKEAQGIIDAAENKVSPRAQARVSDPAVATAEPTNAHDYWEYLKQQGQDAASATAMTHQKFPNAVTR